MRSRKKDGPPAAVATIARRVEAGLDEIARARAIASVMGEQLQGRLTVDEQALCLFELERALCDIERTARTASGRVARLQRIRKEVSDGE